MTPEHAATPRPAAALPPQPSPAVVRADVVTEAPVLARWAAGYRAVLEKPLEVESFSSQGVEGTRLRVTPDAFEQATLVGGSGHFRHMPAMAAHVRSLGFDWEGEGRLWGFPSPGTFNALLPALAERWSGPGAGFSLDWVEHDGDVLPMGPWLRRTIDGRFSMHVCSEARYATGAASAMGRSQARFSLQSVVHDLTTHGLNSHLIPREATDAIGRRIAGALPERFRGWADDDALPPLHLAYFFDNDLNKYLYAVWCRTSHPGDFAARFTKPAHWAQVLEILDRRIDEVRRGLSDVKSGDTNDVTLSADPEYRVD